ncbi:MAG TPA: sugar-binding transcriptional regulator [Propionibacteriaceae bacterium]|jgi:DNA-binding transcriptional regulator LsrR (DeoR family)
MYHEQDLKQPQIAELLHVSQAKVSRLLKRAEELGIVKVLIVPPSGGHSELEEALVSRYGLLDAVVADSPSGDEKAIISAVGAAAALYLEDVLLGHERIGISSWSETLLAMVTVLTRRPQPVAETVAQVIGGVGIPEAQVQATRLTEQLAALTGGQPLFLPTPGVVSGKALRDAMLEEPYVAQVVEAWSRLTVLLAGIGSLDPSPLLRRSGNAIAEADQEALRTLGAVGDICLRFFDAAGQHVDSGLDGRVIGIDPQTLLAVPRRVGVAGGPRKHSAIRAAVLGGWVNVLVTDVDTAEALLA